MECLTDDGLQAFVRGTLAPDERALAERHVDSCMLCRMTVAELALLETQSPATGEPVPFREGDGAGGSSSVGRILPPRTVVARYVVARTVGSGRGGVVYEAHDPQLDRTVGLKLLRSHPAQGVSEDVAQLGLLREAQAMAKLSHPNVVLIHDVGTFAGQVFIVLEYIQGVTLTEWLAERPRHWREILAMFIGAGRGLAAAHAANIIHRDFKPDNVLVGADGVPRLTDFGLARSTGLARDASYPGGHRAPPSDPGLTALQTAPAGTPAFMAPEQHRRGTADAKSDQFAFCVALHWSLFGHHPFRAETPSAGAPVGEDAKNDPAPNGVREAVLRGLAGTPEQRFASMDDLLTALTHAARVDTPARLPARRGLWLLLGGLVATASAAAWLLRAPSAQVGNGRSAATQAPAAATRAPPARPAPLATLPIPPSPGTAHCEGNGVAAVRHCFTLYEQPLDWLAADDACQATGGFLATCASAVECEALVKAASTRSASWLGLRAGGREGGYEWATGEVVLPYLLGDRVQHGAATGPGTRQSCLVVSAGIEAGRAWLPRRCEQQHSYICETAQWHESPVTRHSYRVLSVPSTWQEARERCQRLGIHLATVGDATEQAFIEATVFSDIITHEALWIGATDLADGVKGAYAWTTAEPFGYTAFHDQQPDNLDGNQDCLVIDGRSRRWHDRYCMTKYPAVCEAEPDWTEAHLGP